MGFSIRNDVSAVNGSTHSVSADITNVGVTTAKNFMVKFHTDSPSARLVPLGTTQIVSSLAPGATTTVVANATFEASDPYYAIKVEAIPSVEQGDANFGDNEATGDAYKVGLPAGNKVTQLAAGKDYFQRDNILSEPCEMTPVLGTRGTVIVLDTDTPHHAGFVEPGHTRRVVRIDITEQG